jgi:hypothetical protein
VLLASGVAVAAVGLGLLLGLGSGGRSMLVGPLRTFAFAAALTVALTHLLPEALRALGAPGLLLFAGASVAPLWGALVRSFMGARNGGHGHGRAVLGAGYAGLLVHHVGDGLGLGAYSELPGGAASHVDVLVALAVHTVPLVAVVTLAFGAQRGKRAAVERALGLAGASILGVVLSGSVPAKLAESLSAWIAAGVAGLLIHVVTHDLGRDLPETPAARGLDALAAALGIGSCLLGAEPELAAMRHAMLEGLVRGAVVVPAAVVGVWLATALSDGAAARIVLGRGPGAGRGLDGALAGMALTGVKTGLLFWVGSVLAGRISTLRERLAGGHEHDDEDHVHHEHAHDPHVELPEPRQGKARLVELLRESTPWLVTGLVMFALLCAGLEPLALASLGAPLALAAAAVCALPIQLPSVPAMLIGAALWERGLRPDAALGFALMASVKPSLKPWAVVVALLVGIGVGSGTAGASLAAPAVPPFVGYVGAALALAGVAYEVALRGGVRGLFTAVFHSHDSA